MPLSNPEPDPFNNILRAPLRPMRICGIQRRLARLDIRLRTRDPSRPLEDLPESIEHKVDRDSHITRHEAVLVPRAKNVEAVEDSYYCEENEGKVRGVWLEGRFEDKGIAINALCVERVVESYVGNGNRHPGEE